jgi:trehalose 6-phosphate phosphatase
VAFVAGDPLAPLRQTPATAGIFSDFDGTLSPIVKDPAAAKPVAGVPELLDRLARRFAIVAVVSGRPVDFLASQLPTSILLVGLYGLEVLQHGERQSDPEAERWREVVSAAASRMLAAVPAGVLVESKGLSVTLHYRNAPTFEAQVTALAKEISASTGLVMRSGKKSVELVPPLHTDKGTVIKRWGSSLESVAYLGDDLGDLTAFRALDELATQDVAAIRIAVRSDESPPELIAAANVIVPAPEAAAGLLAGLL